MTEEQCSLRPLKCELNYLSVPDGSTMFMQGISKKYIPGQSFHNQFLKFIVYNLVYKNIFTTTVFIIFF